MHAVLHPPWGSIGLRMNPNLSLDGPVDRELLFLDHVVWGRPNATHWYWVFNCLVAEGSHSPPQTDGAPLPAALRHTSCTYPLMHHSTRFPSVFKNANSAFDGNIDFLNWTVPAKCRTKSNSETRSVAGVDWLTDWLTVPTSRPLSVVGTPYAVQVWGPWWWWWCITSPHGDALYAGFISIYVHSFFIIVRGHQCRGRIGSPRSTIKIKHPSPDCRRRAVALLDNPCRHDSSKAS